MNKILKNAFLGSVFLIATASGAMAQTVSDVFISGNFTVGSRINAYYTVSGITDQIVELEWFRYSPRASVAVSVDHYTLLSTEFSKKVYFRVVIKDNTGTTVIAKDSSSYSPTVTANKAPVASGVDVLGVFKSGKTVYGIYNYSDQEGDAQGTSTFRWTVSDDDTGDNETAISGATSQSYTISDTYRNKYLKFYVTPVAATGTASGSEESHTGYKGPVTNSKPVATAVTVTGSKNVYGVMNGNYTYTDDDDDPESGSTYRWLSASTETGSYSAISGANTKAYGIKLTEQGRWFKFEVTPRAASGNVNGIPEQSAAFGPANSKPVASSVNISGSTTRGSVLTGSFSFSDPDGDGQGTHIYRWLRDGVEISGADQTTYTLKVADVGSRIRFEVTPVSSAGYPTTGDPVQSSQTAVITDPGGTPPNAKDVCISGRRELGFELTGNYFYESSSYSEGTSVYMWYRGTTKITGATTKKYTLVSADLNKEIRFGVIPINSQGTRNDTVFSAPLAIFTIPRTDFSIADSAIVLTANPAGGVFSGPGVINGKFNPSIAGFPASPHTLEYVLNIENPNTTCIQRAYSEVTVSDVTLAFESFEDFYCTNGANDQISVRNLPKNYSNPRLKVTNPAAEVARVNDSTIIVNPAKLSTGAISDSLKFTVFDGTRDIRIARRFIVEKVDTAKITNTEVLDFICSSTSPIKLNVSPSNGIFTGPVVNGNLVPAVPGDAVITYSVSTPLGCVSTSSYPIHIYPSAAVQFSAKDTCIANSADSIKFINSSSPKTGISWKWEFSDLGVVTESQKEAPSFLFKTGGSHKVVLSATTTDGCITRREENLDLGVVPSGDFYWRRDCFSPTDSLVLRDTSSSFSTIISRTWKIFDGGVSTIINNKKYPKYDKTAERFIDIEYILRTGYFNCHDTVRKKIYIRPTKEVTADGYYENFEGGRGGWENDFEDKGFWTLGTPNRKSIIGAASGSNAWFTGFPLDVSSGSYSVSVISPCFDFSAIDKPAISIEMRRNFDYLHDGAALQYKSEDDDSWTYVGTINDGIEWYNSALIKGRPGGDPLGWTSEFSGLPDESWVQAKHALKELAGKKGIKFRLVYATDGAAENNAGMAFDDVWIGPRTRNILLEHFTNISNTASDNATLLVSTVAKNRPGELINIQYHTNFPGADGYYSDNPGDANARVLFYGLSRVPFTVTDGGYDARYFARAYSWVQGANLDTNHLSLRSLDNPPFELTINSNASGGTLTVNGSVKALENITVSNMTLYIAVTEKKSTQHTGGSAQTEFYNVFRKFIPNGAGFNLDKIWTKDKAYSFTDLSWTMDKIKNGADIEVIAFIQNNITKEIYQAVSDKKTAIVVGIEDEFPQPDENFNIYPNPSDGRVVVVFGNRTAFESEINISSLSGKTLKTYKAAQGLDEFIIDDAGLPDGIYLVGVKQGTAVTRYRKLVISQR